MRGEERGIEMGKCIKCGKETANSYAYHTGEVSDFSSYKTGSATVTEVKYTNIQAHVDFLCTRCLKLKDVITWLLCALPFIAFMILSLAGVVGFVPSDKVKGLIFFSIGAFILTLLFIHSLVLYKNDKRLSDYTGAAEIVKLKSKEKTRTHYFTPEEYEKLNKS
jgi:hypothetical protein